MYITFMNISGLRYQTDRETLFALMRAASSVEQRMEEALGGIGLSLARLGALTHLAEAGEPLTLGELAERVHCVRSNVTQLVDRLEGDGLVERRNDLSDRRVIRAALTGRGRELQATGSQLLGGVEADVMRTIEPDQARLLGEILAALR
jgi:DNA-binding MarR family transcriptional regulator